MSTLIKLCSIGQGAEIAGDDQLARAIETVAFLICNRRFGPDFWEEHAVECLGSKPKAQAQRLHYLSPSADRARLRSETFSGIAEAMAEQWGQA